VRYRAHKDMLLEFDGGRHYAAVPEPIFVTMFAHLERDLWSERPDLRLRFFTLAYRIRVRTPLGHCEACAGDWIIEAREGGFLVIGADLARTRFAASSA
jgi:hypothetical protein